MADYTPVSLSDVPALIKSGAVKIDLALVHFWFPLHPEMAKLLQEIIQPAHIGLTHLPIRLESDAPGKIDMAVIQGS